MRKPIYILLIIFIPVLVRAQVSEEANVTAVINRLFTGMHKADSMIVGSTFAQDATMASVAKNKEGNTIVRKDNVNDFISFVGKQKPESFTEEIWNVKVQIDGEFAQAWCDYAFYVGNKFSHCGVDAFHLYKSPDGWKIFHLADTRRKVGCNIPAEIQKKYPIK